MLIQIKEAQNKFEQTAETTTANLVEQSTETTTPYPSYSSSSISPLIYVTDKEKSVEADKNPLKSRLDECFSDENGDQLNTSFPLFFQNIDTILIPKKAKRHLERCLPKEYLRSIDSNRDLAIEKCLLSSSNLSSTLYSDDIWKSLSSRIMHEQTKKGKDNTRIYHKIIKALKYSTDTSEGIIQVKKNVFDREIYQEGVASKQYAYTATYYDSSQIEYILKDEDIIQKRYKFFYSLLKKALENDIAKNLIGIYPKIDLPTLNRILLEAKRLIKAKHKNKKGRTLTFLNKHPKSYYKDARTRSFVEDNIKLYDYLTKRSLMIPIIGSEKSGGRVVDSFTLMPSWIRKLVKIDGEPIVEVDFKALHPNIAMSIYGGSKKYLTHDMVAKESNIDVADVKIEHLSYFNKEVRDIKRSPLYSHYNESETVMNETIIREKQTSVKGHKITSMRMFAKEVEIMTECIKQLNSKGIYVGYVYDALFCKESDAKIVEEIMNKVVLEFGVYTIASIG
jgi:hypothetical protein